MTTAPVGLTLCAVDVGVKYHAEAWFSSTGVLCNARLVKNVEPIACGGRLVIECATVRAQDGAVKKREVDALNRAAGRLGALHPAPEYQLPEAWKGQTSKAIDQARALKRLTEVERALLPLKKGELLHVLDAVSMGLRAVGRK